MNIIKSFENAFNRMEERNWEKIYVLVDIHDTIFEACYHNKEEYKWYPYAKDTLDIMTHLNQISLILWSSTYNDVLEEYREYFKINGISFDMININNETENTSLSCFNEKTYFNVGIDDKFGFEANEDWKIIYDYLTELIRLGKIR